MRSRRRPTTIHTPYEAPLFLRCVYWEIFALSALRFPAFWPSAQGGIQRAHSTTCGTHRLKQAWPTRCYAYTKKLKGERSYCGAVHGRQKRSDLPSGSRAHRVRLNIGPLEAGRLLGPGPKCTSHQTGGLMQDRKEGQEEKRRGTWVRTARWRALSPGACRIATPDDTRHTLVGNGRWGLATIVQARVSAQLARTSRARLEGAQAKQFVYGSTRILQQLIPWVTTCGRCGVTVGWMGEDAARRAVRTSSSSAPPRAEGGMTDELRRIAV